MTQDFSPTSFRVKGTSSPRIILGSRSPRRKELLSLIFPDGQIQILPPADPREEELIGCLSMSEVEQGLWKIARQKCQAVAAQTSPESYDFLLTADTSVVVPSQDSSFEEQQFLVLGKPHPGQYPQQVQEWFECYYLGKSHQVLTAICLQNFLGQQWSEIVSTRVTFSSASPEEVQWYLNTGESLGKAGGYAIQGLGSCFVSEIQGSLSNVIGLPLLETRHLFQAAIS